MKGITMKNIFIKSMAVAAALFAFAACKVGLGEAIDLEAPVVTITKPAARESVPEQFEVSGTVRDNTDVKKLVLTVGDNIWTYEKGAWTFNGQPYEDADWISTGKRTYEWTVRGVRVDTDGEYVLKVNTYDENGNTSDTSVAQRTVVYDMNAPKVTIASPSLYPSLAAIKEALNTYTATPSTGYQNYSMLENFINGKFEISGNQEETFTLKFMRVYLQDEASHEIWKSPLYVAKERYVQDAIDNNIAEEGEEYKITGSLRSFNIAVPDLSVVEPDKGPNTLWGGIIDKPKYLKVVTVSSDSSGNLESEQDEEGEKVYKVSQGWFCYYPQADKPWIVFDMIGNHSSAPYKCYPGTKLQGYSYDDDGIETIAATIRQINTGLTKTETLYSRKTKDPTTYQTWSITAPTTDGEYYAEVVVTDINGNKSSVKSGYFKVTDVNYPNLTINAPPKDKTLFGDKDGKFTFDITADDDSGVAKILCVHLTKESDAAYYLNPDDERWTKIPSNTKYQEHYIDAVSKNKHWYITPALAGTIGNANGERKKFVPDSPFTLNLFSTLGIDGETAKLVGQHFIFYVEDNSGNKLTYDYAIQGDMEVPTITIDTMTINGTPTEFKGKNLSNIEEGTQIVLSGTFGDDSLEAWGMPASGQPRFPVFSVMWNNTPLTITKDYASGKTGAWRASFEYGATYAPAGSNVSVYAQIADYAGNSKSDSTYFTIDATVAMLQGITSTNASSTYKAGDKLVIVLKFNKNITVANAPTLTLNSGGTATYAEGTGSQNLKFEYTVKSTDKNTAKLDVTKINYNPGDFKDGDVNVTPAAASATSNGINLAQNKTIAIITSRPNFVSAAFEGETLVLEYETAVSKNAGKVTIEQTAASLTKVPAVLTETQFRKWNNADKSTNLAEFYTKGTNGADSKGAADLTTKYVLNYDIPLNNTTLLDSYKTANLHKITVDIMSSAASIDETKVKITLAGSFALPCKGASYTVNAPEGLVLDVANNESQAVTNQTVQHNGVEPPVIRVKKSKAVFNKTNLAAEQPLQSNFKIDCQTTGATISYGINDTAKYAYDADSAKMTIEAGGKETTPPTPKPFNTTDVAFTADKTGLSSATSIEQEIGENSWTSGQKIFIKAESKNGAATAASYETAFRSVFVFDEDDEGYATGGGGEIIVKTLGENGRVWIRGSDAETGSPTTAGFPLNWVEDDYKTGQCGAALLTKDEDSGKWYYVTWELTTTAYIGIMAGVADEDSDLQGPAEWCYSVNSWIPFKKHYCLFPGESRYVSVKDYFANNGSILGSARGVFGFVGTTTARDGTKTVYKGGGTGGGNQAKEFKESKKFEGPFTAGQYIYVSCKLTGSWDFKDFSVNLSNTEVDFNETIITESENEGIDPGKTYSGYIQIDKDMEYIDCLGLLKTPRSGETTGIGDTSITIDLEAHNNKHLEEYETEHVSINMAGYSGQKIHITGSGLPSAESFNTNNNTGYELWATFTLANNTTKTEKLGVIDIYNDNKLTYDLRDDIKAIEYWFKFTQPIGVVFDAPSATTNTNITVKVMGNTLDYDPTEYSGVAVSTYNTTVTVDGVTGRQILKNELTLSDYPLRAISFQEFTNAAAGKRLVITAKNTGRNLQIYLKTGNGTNIYNYQQAWNDDDTTKTITITLDDAKANALKRGDLIFTGTTSITITSIVLEN